MAIITIPATPEKDVEQEYSLDVTELNLLVSQEWFKDQTKLKAIDVIYKSSVSNQLEAIRFIPDGSMTLTSMAMFAARARDLFEIQSILIMDKQNGRYFIQKSDVPSVASYNIAF